MLRSIRFGEADRVLHLYSAERGRVGAVAKGVRRMQVAPGRPAGAAGAGEAGAARGPGRAVHGHGGGHRARPPGAARAPAAARARHPGLRRGAAPVRLRRAQPARLQPALQPARAARRRPGGGHAAPTSLAFRIKLLLAAGFAPELALVRLLRRGARTWAASRPAAGGVVCAALRGRLVPARRGGPRASWSAPWPARWPRRPRRAERALAQADRAIAETLEHHAHVRLRRVA